MFTKTLGYGFAVVIGSCALIGSISTRSVVRVDESALAEVRRAPGDGLDNVVTTELVCGASEALAACTSWDIKENCCPAGCAAKKGSNWPKADDILRGCMRGLGCSEDEVKGATVFMKCDCDKK
jgi:hypothetical protein